MLKKMTSLILFMIFLFCSCAPYSYADEFSSSASSIMIFSDRFIQPIVVGRGDTWLMLDTACGTEFSISASSSSLNTQASGDTSQSFTNWQESGRFDHLQPGVCYKLASRSSVTHAGEFEVSEATTLVPPSFLESGSFESDTWVSLRSFVKDGSSTTVYSDSPSGPWTSEGVFRNLNPGCFYTFYMKLDGDAGTIVVPVGVSTRSVPAAIEVSTFGDNWIRINPQDGIQYSLDGVNWNDSGFFDGLEPGSTYTVWSRVSGGTLLGASISITLPGGQKADEQKEGLDLANTGDGLSFGGIVLSVFMVSLVTSIVLVNQYRKKKDGENG